MSHFIKLISVASSDELRLGPGVDLFNFLADCVQDFVITEGLEKEEMPLGA